jgi:hypothetical protein
MAGGMHHRFLDGCRCASSTRAWRCLLSFPHQVEVERKRLAEQRNAAERERLAAEHAAKLERLKAEWREAQLVAKAVEEGDASKIRKQAEAKVRLFLLVRLPVRPSIRPPPTPSPLPWLRLCRTWTAHGCLQPKLAWPALDSQQPARHVQCQAASGAPERMAEMSALCTAAK